MPHRYHSQAGDHDPAHWMRHAVTNVGLALRLYDAAGGDRRLRLDALHLLTRAADDCLAAVDALHSLQCHRLLPQSPDRPRRRPARPPRA